MRRRPTWVSFFQDPVEVHLWLLPVCRQCARSPARVADKAIFNKIAVGRDLSADSRTGDRVHAQLSRFTQSSIVPVLHILSPLRLRDNFPWFTFWAFLGSLIILRSDLEVAARFHSGRPSSEIVDEE